MTKSHPDWLKTLSKKYINFKYFEVKCLVNEPTAAAVAYALDKKQDSKILV